MNKYTINTKRWQLIFYKHTILKTVSKTNTGVSVTNVFVLSVLYKCLFINAPGKWHIYDRPGMGFFAQK
jgi:hypothetical protein